MISIISIILLVIFSIILLSIYKNKKSKLENYYKEKEEVGYEEYYKNKLNQEKQKVDEELAIYHLDKSRELHQWIEQKENERNSIERGLIERKQAVEEIIEQLELRRREAENAYQKAILNGQEKIDIELEGYRKVEVEKLNNNLATEFEEKKQLSLIAFNEYSNQLAADLTKAREELLAVVEELEEYKKKQAAHNEEILRRRQVEEQQDFYRVVLDETSISDIQILLSIREKLTSHENLDKLIYDGYVAKPVMEMVKRVLGGRAPSGIYKITRLKTGEIYIGKSIDIKKRWGEHCKTAFGVGSIAHSILHTTIKRDGIENFTFELLEEVPKEKLTEREKYWITFYQSKEYGLNEKVG